MSKSNRLVFSQRDYQLIIILKPAGWRPKNYFDKPRRCKVVSRTPVASYEEAHDDLVRCNRLSLQKSLDTWAVIQPDESP